MRLPASEIDCLERRRLIRLLLIRLFLNYTKSQVSKLDTNLHRSTLRVYLEAGIPPKGLRLTHPPAMNDLSVCDRTEWQSVLDAASLKLVGLTITDYERKTTCLIEQGNIILKSHPFTPIEIQEKYNFETKLRKELVTVKIRKLARDNVNYDLEKFIMNTEARHEHTLTSETNSPPATHTASINNEERVENSVQSVVNLSKITLSSNEYTLLSKGLNFCPTLGNWDEFQVFRDLDYFARNLRLREYFADRPQAT